MVLCMLEVNQTADHFYIHACVYSAAFSLPQDANALAIGTQQPAAARDAFTSVEQCLTACDYAGDRCVGVTLLSTVETVKAATTCALIGANTQPGSPKRSMVHTDLTRLMLPSAFLCPSGFTYSGADAHAGLVSCDPLTTPQVMVLVLTAAGMCSPAATASIQSALQALLSDPNQAGGVYVPNLRIEVDCYQIPDGQVRPATL